jgi:hypothetical protein
VKDADKDSHAKMLVELRWADDAMAKTDKRPSIDPVFGTDTGMYSATLEQAPVSFLHPEENGKGYVYWYYYVESGREEPARERHRVPRRCPLRLELLAAPDHRAHRVQKGVDCTHVG